MPSNTFTICLQIRNYFDIFTSFMENTTDHNHHADYPHFFFDTKSKCEHLEV